LGIKRSSSQEEIKKAYFNLAKKFHPDVNKEPDANAKFTEINKAYETLSDEKKKKLYDQDYHSETHESVHEEDHNTYYDFNRGCIFEDDEEYVEEFSFGSDFDPFEAIFSSMGRFAHRKSRTHAVQKKQNINVGNIKVQFRIGC